MRKNKLHMTRKDAKARSIAVWEYIVAHPEANKRHLPKNLERKVRMCRCWCPLCELYWERDDARGELICTSKCPLSAAGECCGDSGSLFEKWFQTEEDIGYASDRGDEKTVGSLTIDRIILAQGILDIIKAWEV